MNTDHEKLLMTKCARFYFWLFASMTALYCGWLLWSLIRAGLAEVAP